MKKVRLNFEDAETGRTFMQEVAGALDAEISEQDAKQVINSDGFQITCQFYFDGSAFSLLKYEEDTYETILQPIISKYQD